MNHNDRMKLADGFHPGRLGTIKFNDATGTLATCIVTKRDWTYLPDGSTKIIIEIKAECILCADGQIR